MSEQNQNYRCGALACENKGPARKDWYCTYCSHWMCTACEGYFERLCYSEEKLPHVYVLIDELGSKEEDNHLVYLFFRALMNAESSLNGKSFGKLHKVMTGLIDVSAWIESWDERKSSLQCKEWCKKKQSNDCDSGCTIAASYLNDILRSGGPDALALVKQILDTFMVLPGYSKKKGYTVCDEIMSTDPFSCVGAGQYRLKVLEGIEISLYARFEEWLEKQHAWRMQASETKEQTA